MKLVIGGTISIILGFLGFALYFSDFINFMEGILPLVFIIGGILVIILKREENAYEPEDSQDSFSQTTETTTIEPEEQASDEIEPAVIEPIETQVMEAPTSETASEDKPVEKLVEKSAESAVEIGTNFIGNESSHVFHTQDCKYSASKKCTQSFSSRTAAIEQGYKPCGVCKP